MPIVTLTFLGNSARKKLNHWGNPRKHGKTGKEKQSTRKQTKRLKTSEIRGNMATKDDY